ncbi:RhoGAP-domain-containing protein [Guyanagaster necrorhizus]|uniref:RhoGAP-domain-containing protein n=1 Tax=Guyanagaster necrorhizus TaxID=856835 RepID=A0A9P7VRL4_9AGAR|nr:RhoGAP-domain-containing protein [Guyanagaster necrorhizus MCA 3950]KAG7445547.1 RhoGAP-domain-containing protein [Guyanagaster necrorhizus MCA 3950]
MPPNSLSLKQRLAALSIGPSTPLALHAVDTPLRSPKRKNFFNVNALWNKRSESTHAQEQQANVQDVMARLIFQAGVDFETRPMVVLNASALPDPREVNYDVLLSRILSYLNLYVEADYTVVFFAAGGKHAPGWNWVWKAYRSLSRKYRKNLKLLFIVHSSLFSKMLYSLAGAIVSPKFFRKIVYVDTLSALAAQIPITQIDIPPAIYQENAKHEKRITLPTPVASSIFGVPLADLMGYEGENGGIPRVVRDCIQFLRETGMEAEGLFRRSPPSVLLRALQEAYDRGNVVSLEAFGDPHIAAVLLKKYLRDLPEPIFPEPLYLTIRRCPPPSSDPADMAAVSFVRETLLPSLPPCVYILLSHVLHLMHEVSLRSASNLMDAHNLAVVLTPNLVSGTNPLKDVMMCTVPGGPAVLQSSGESNPAVLPESKTTLGMVIKLCIERYYEIFDEVRDRTEALPVRQPQEDSRGSSGASSLLSSFKAPVHVLQNDDEEDSIDDGMLVMPIGPAHGYHPNPSISGPPSAWNGSTFKPRHRSTLSGGSGKVKSMQGGGGGGGGGGGYEPVTSKARSTISIESGNGAVRRKGSISVGRGTNRKSSGAGVEAIGITAEGFFTAPVTAPPVPSLKPRTDS